MCSFWPARPHWAFAWLLAMTALPALLPGAEAQEPLFFPEAASATPEVLRVDDSGRHPYASEEPLTEGAFDAVGSYEGSDPKPPGRPLYPYRAKKYWYPQDADVEEWGDLLELPHVQPGWFWDAETTIFKSQLQGHFNSGTTLDAVFPGNPVTRTGTRFDWNASPRIEAGYRFEHGLGEARLGYRFVNADRRDSLSGFDPLGPATLASEIQGHFIDFDMTFLEFNAEGLPSIPPMARNFGRFGLGKPLTNNRLSLPLEIRWTFGARASNMFYRSRGTGPSVSDQVLNDVWSGGVHFATQLDQQISADMPLFLHARFEGSGVWGLLNQQFSRTVAGVGSATGGVKGNGIGIPTVDLEVGLSWVPKWPCRDSRFTFGYHFEEWFTFADSGIGKSNAYFLMHGLLLRAEHRF
jgi:hypothetical protein